MFGRKSTDSAWRSRVPDRATCVRCLQEKDLEEKDAESDVDADESEQEEGI